MNLRKNILVALGTRPEAIKLAPVIRQINDHPELICTCMATAQHRDLMDNVLSFFKIKPEFDLNLMKDNQDLSYTTEACLNRIKLVLTLVKPSMVVVQGDTATAFATSLAAYYAKIPVAHVEAGLRTHDIYSPFPEEGYRKLIGAIAELHFPPTEQAKNNLLRENISPSKIVITGNTSIDALHLGLREDLPLPKQLQLKEKSPIILLTAHRRENFGAPIKQIFNAIRTFAINHPEFQIVYPVHPNPNVSLEAHKILTQVSNIHLLDPLDYPGMLAVLKRTQFVVTDSGGLQEEAPSLGIPTLVLRDRTERTEAVQSGCAQLVGSNPEVILHAMTQLSDTHSPLFKSMAKPTTIFGDGRASQKIIEKINDFICNIQKESISCAASSGM